MNARAIGLTGFLLAAVAVSSWYVFQQPHPTSTPPAQPNTPDFYMTRAVYSRFDDTGRLRSQLKTPKAKHYKENDTLLFTTPLLTSFPPDKGKWQISAQSGKSQNHNHIVYLWNNVQLHEFPSKHNHETTIDTSAATIYPKKELAKTDRPVKLVQPGWLIKGIGAVANLKTGEVTLLSHPEAQYEPDQVKTHEHIRNKKY